MQRALALALSWEDPPPLCGDHRQEDVMLNGEQMMRRQKVLADFGEFALRSDDLDAVLTEACRLVGEALGTGHAKILEIQKGGQSLLVRAGFGWKPDIVGHLRLPMSEHSSETYSIQEGKPIITQDISKEDRFKLPDFLKEAGVVALANVPIFLPGGQAYGLLQVDASEPRTFGEDETEFLRTYATILGPVIDRLRQVQTLRRQEESFRLIIENALDYSIYLTDAEDRITEWLPGAEAVFGWTADEVEGKPSSILFTPEDREKGEDKKEVETARREGSAPNVRWHLRKDGSRVFIDGSARALRDHNGEVRGFLKMGQDVTERMQAEAALRESEARLQSALSISTVGVLFWDADFRLKQVNDALLAMTDFNREEVLGKPWQDLTPEEFHPVSERAIEEVAMTGEATPYEKQYFRKDGSRWWGLFAPRRIDDEAVEFVLDISDRKQAEEALRASEGRARLLLAELQHRVRNTLAVVRSIARRTAETSESVEDYAMHLDGRIAAFADVQAQVTRNPSAGIALDMLVADTLIGVGAHEGARVRSIKGPTVRLQPKAAETVALALHELATNAVKYGALTTEQGRIAVEWYFETRGEHPRLIFHWIETGVKLSGVQPTRIGFGTELIERTLAYDLNGIARLNFKPDGLHCSINLPADGEILVKDGQPVRNP